jgi:predicted RNA binding protein YcfA (HicA-like mRNA interferase family)
VRALERIGFVVARQRGSHVFLKHADGRATVVPVHRRETLGPGILLKIARDIEMTRDELLALMCR